MTGCFGQLRYQTRKSEPDDMSSKVANLIAVELAVLIALMAWLAFSNLRSVKSPPITQRPERMVDSFATVAPLRNARTRQPAPVDYRADLEPIAELDQTAQEYEPATANQPYINSDLNTGYAAATSPSYALFDPQPRLTSEDCLFSPVDQYLFYPQTTALVVYSTPRTFNRRFQSPGRRTGARPAVGHRRPTSFQQLRPRDRGAAPREKMRLRLPSTGNPRVRPRQTP
ncbi:MAG: hypothetical protein M3480_05175 [Verrucomicrobiota bacterium]|nr:hypothetical protein [Verrucomicrobiota bacterium]